MALILLILKIRAIRKISVPFLFILF